MDVIRPADRAAPPILRIEIEKRRVRRWRRKRAGGEDREQNIGKFFIANAISRVLHVPATEGLSILSKLKISIQAKGAVVLLEAWRRIEVTFA